MIIIITSSSSGCSCSCGCSCSSSNSSRVIIIITSSSSSSSTTTSYHHYYHHRSLLLSLRLLVALVSLLSLLLLLLLFVVVVVVDEMPWRLVSCFAAAAPGSWLLAPGSCSCCCLESVLEPKIPCLVSLLAAAIRSPDVPYSSKGRVHIESYVRDISYRELLFVI